MVSYLVRAGDANETVNNQTQVVGDPREMDAFATGEVSDANLQLIIGWLQGFPQPTAGVDLFTRNCSFCHGSTGKGGTTEYASPYHSAPFDRQDLASFTAYVKAGHTSEAGSTIDPSDRRTYMPPFAGVLTDAEIGLIFEWASAQ